VDTGYSGGPHPAPGGRGRAPGGRVQLAHDTRPRAERVDFVDVVVTVGYGAVTAAQQLFAAHEAAVVDVVYGVDVRYDVRVPRPSVNALRTALADVTRGDALFEDSLNAQYCSSRCSCAAPPRRRRSD
jgi:putative IMPACT (imprinted ancient) family translation regulator